MPTSVHLPVGEVIDTMMREAVVGLVALRGFALEDYVLLSFGGAGPTHVAGYTSGLPLKAVLTFPYAAVFSAFGAAAADYEHHYHRAVNVVVAPGAATVSSAKARTCQPMFGLAPPSIHCWISATSAKAATMMNKPSPILRSGVSFHKRSPSG